jgi:hypothetical protein
MKMAAQMTVKGKNRVRYLSKISKFGSKVHHHPHFNVHVSATIVEVRKS